MLLLHEHVCRAITAENDQFIGNTQDQQQLLLARQDQDLDDLSAGMRIVFICKDSNNSSHVDSNHESNSNTTGYARDFWAV